MLKYLDTIEACIKEVKVLYPTLENITYEIDSSYNNKMWAGCRDGCALIFSSMIFDTPLSFFNSVVMHELAHVVHNQIYSNKETLSVKSTAADPPFRLDIETVFGDILRYPNGYLHNWSHSDKFYEILFEIFPEGKEWENSLGDFSGNWLVDMGSIYETDYIAEIGS